MHPLTKKIDDYLDQVSYNGAVLIAQGDDIVLEKGYGYANLEHGVKNTPQTVFRIASITKQFTAAAILKLAEEGKLTLDDRLELYFPDYPQAHRLTIHHLLANASGIPNFEIDMDFYDILKSEDPLMALIKLAYDKELLYEPGTEFFYSMSGYLMLQKIIEICSGSGYEEYLKKTFFEPLGMTKTGVEKQGRVVKDWAYGYKPDGDGYLTSDPIDMQIAGGGGAMYSTVKDLHLWNNSLLRSDLLQASSTQKIFSEQVRFNEDTVYGYGMVITMADFDGRKVLCYYHTGGGPGVRSINMIFPEEKVQIILISNLEDRETFGKVTDRLQELMIS